MKVHPAPNIIRYPVKELHSSLHTPLSEHSSVRLPYCTSSKSCTFDIARQQSTFGPITSWHSNSSASSIPLQVLGGNIDNDRPEEENNNSPPLKLGGSIRRLLDAIIPAGPPCHYPCHHPEDSTSGSNIELSVWNHTNVPKASENWTHHQLINNGHHSSRYCVSNAPAQELKSFASETTLSLPFSRSSSVYSYQESKVLKKQRELATNAPFDETIFDRDDPNSGSTDRENSEYSSLFTPSPPQNPTVTPMEPSSPFRRTRVPIESSQLQTFRDYPSASTNGEIPSKVLSHSSPQSPIRNSDLLSSLSIPTSPTSPRSPCMQPKAFSNKPPRPTPGVVKVIPTSPSEFMPSIAQSQKEKSRLIPRPIPLKRQPSSLTQHPSQFNFSSNRSSSKEIPVFANAASRAYMKSVSINSAEEDKIPVSLLPTPTSPVSPKSSQSNIFTLQPRSKVRPPSPTRIKSAMTPISFTKGTSPIQTVSNRKSDLTSAANPDVNTPNESKSSVFKSTSSFFQAARGKSFSVSSRLASSLTSGKSESTIARALPRNVRRVLRPQKGCQNLTPKSTAQQQSTVPFFKPLQLSEVSREDTPITKDQNRYHEKRTSMVSRKQSEGTDDGDDAQDYESSSSFFNVTSSSLFRTSSASSASSVSRKSFLSTFRPQPKGQVDQSKKSRTKSETLPRVFPRGSKPPKAPSKAIPRGRTSGDLSATRLTLRDKSEKTSQKQQTLAQNEALLKSQVPDRPRQSALTRKNLVSSRRPPLIPKTVSNKTRVAVQIFKEGKEDKAVSPGMSPRSDNLQNTNSIQSSDIRQNIRPLSEDSQRFNGSIVDVKQEIPSDLGQGNREALELAFSQNGEDSQCSGDSFNPDSDDMVWCSTDLDNVGDMKAVLLTPSYRMDGNSVLLPRTMSIVKFPKNTFDGAVPYTSEQAPSDAWKFAEDVDEFDKKNLCEESSSRNELASPIKSSIFLHPGARTRKENENVVNGRDLPESLENSIAELNRETEESDNYSGAEIAERKCLPAVMDESVIRTHSQQKPQTEPTLSDSFETVELCRRASDSICVDSHRYGVYPAYRMLSDWFESELQESDLSPCVLPNEDDLNKLSHIPPVQWAAQSLQSCKVSLCPHNSFTGSCLPWRSASMPSVRTVVHPNGSVFCPFHSTMIWSSCPCVNGISCQSSSVAHQQATCTTTGTEQSTSQLLSPPASIDNLPASFGFRRFTGDLKVDRRIMHLEVIQRQLREKIRLSNWGGKKGSPHGTEVQLPSNAAHSDSCHNMSPQSIFEERSLRQVGVVP